MSENFTTKERKKEFDKIFKEKIVPFFESEGFKRVSKTTKRLYKTLEKGLSVYIYFEYKNFGSGFYDISIAYYDEELGDENSGNYLTIALVKKPHLKGKNPEELHRSTATWIQEMKSKVIPFINEHSDHTSILHSDSFYFPKTKEDSFKELMRRKSAP